MSLLEALLLDPPRIDTWVAKRNDNIAGSGTQNDPYDGSTATKFDTLMSGFAANTCIHFGPGTFETAGYYDGLSGSGWQAKSGMRIVGSGIDVTTLKLVNTIATTQRVYAVAHALSSPTPLVTAVSSFGSLRNDSGWVGFWFQVGATPLTITALGRWIVSGNSGSHTVRLFTADGTQVPGGSVTLNTASQTAGQFAYVTLASPVTLAANTTYGTDDRCRASRRLRGKVVSEYGPRQRILRGGSGLCPVAELGQADAAMAPTYQFNGWRGTVPR